MPHKKSSAKKCALLATGDEIIHGDIINTNSQEIAHRLHNANIPIGFHMTVSDLLEDIKNSIHYLLQNHEALIITGGLGPTTDDLTRYALSEALHKPLVFHDEIWNNIVERITKIGYHRVPESNRQQALFPEGATIIPNPNGSAAGCYLQYQGKWIFMLPGPPIECLPMMDNTVLPILKKNDFVKIIFHQEWFLFGVSEGHIAEKLEALIESHGCTTGYRIFYPYIEFKLAALEQKNLATVLPLIKETIAPYIIDDGKQTASTLLRKKLETLSYTFGIHDTATGGLLETTLKTPANFKNIFFTSEKKFPENMPYVIIEGLENIWRAEENIKESPLRILFSPEFNTGSRGQAAGRHIPKEINALIPVRINYHRALQYAVEFICWEVLKFKISFDSRRPAACPRDPVRTCVIPSVARNLPVSRRSLGVKNTPRDDTGSRGQAAGRRMPEEENF